MAAEIDKLINDSKQFRETYFKKDTTLFDGLVQNGQKPKIMVIACSDSRINPAMIFNCQPGELFVVRNVANLVPPCEITEGYHGTSAALEFAVCFLQVKHIIIFGHTYCGGIQSLLSDSQLLDEKGHSFIAQWMKIAQPAYEQVQHHKNMDFDQKVLLCTQYALINSLHNLETFSWIKERSAQKTLSLHGWYFDLSNGFIYRYDTQHDTWIV